MASDLRVPMAVLADSLGVAATVTPAGETITADATVIWLPDVTYDQPSAGGFARREPRRVMVVMFADLEAAGLLAALPRHSVIDAPLEKSGDVLRWRVDSEQHREWDHVRVIVVQETE